MRNESCRALVSMDSQWVPCRQPQSASQAVHSDALLWLLAPEEQGTPIKGRGSWGRGLWSNTSHGAVHH